MCYSRLAKGGIVVQNLVLAQYVVTALSSAFNAFYFFGYHSPTRRRRIAALTLTVLSAAILIESLYFGFFAFFQEQPWASGFFLNPGYWLAARLLICLGSLLVSILILRQLVANRH